MPIHFRDKQRKANPEKPFEGAFRLLGVNEAGKPYFYWSETEGEYAACFGKSKDVWIWGNVRLPRKNGRGFHGDNINAENRIFIADRETALSLEKAGVTRPCKTCNKEEWNRYEKAGSLELNSKVEIV